MRLLMLAAMACSLGAQTSWVISTLAGRGVDDNTEGVQVRSAWFHSPGPMVFDSSGVLYLADSRGIWKIGVDAVATMHVPGMSVAGLALAADATLYAVDGYDRVYIIRPDGTFIYDCVN